MKRHAATGFLLMAYLLTSLQVVLRVHSCKVSGVDVQVYAAEQKGCCAEKPAPCGEDNHCSLQIWASDCCETAQVTFRLEQPQELTRPLLIPAVSALLPLSLPTLDEADPELPVNLTWIVDPPPPKVSLWRQNCAALTYG